MSLLWQMPLARYTARLQFERCFRPSGAGGATPATSLRGALFQQLLQLACQESGACATTVSGHPCRRLSTCPLGWLYQPRCPYQRRDHASPIGLWVTPVAADQWNLALLLWGHHAIACAEQISAALARAGRAGIGDSLGRVAFACETAPGLTYALAQWCVLPAPAEALLLFETPCDTRADSLSALLGNAAHDLMQWALVDAGESAELGKRGCDALAEQARLEAMESLAAVTCRWLDRSGTAIGARTSRSNRGSFPLQGFMGAAALSGDLAAAWPWLMLLALGGAGGRRAFGMGRVSLHTRPA